MKKDSKNKFDNLANIFDPIEMEELEQELNQYLVKYPDEHHVNATIDTLRQYVPEKSKQTVSHLERFVTLIKRSGTEITLINPSYWIISSLLFIVGYLITSQSAYHPLLTLLILAPLPFVLGLIEVFKGREQGVLEMEMTCKFSAHEIMLSRLFLIGVFNVTLNTMLMISFVPLFDAVSIWQMLMTWFTPLTIFAAIALSLSMKFRGVVFVTIFLVLWSGFCIFTISNQVWIQTLLNLSISFHLLFSCLGIVLLALQVKQLMKKYSSYEGVETVEVSY
jgi:hypothetical protein